MEHVIRLAEEVKNGFQGKQSTLAVFVDFSTAFDVVWRRRLLEKLIDKGIHGRMYGFIRSFLAQRYLRVRYRDATSPFKQTKQGLPQGSVLSPALFRATRNAGAGVFSSAFQIKAPVGIVATNFDGEVKAIQLALEECLKLEQTPDIVILVDSQAAIKAVICCLKVVKTSYSHYKNGTIN